MSQTISRIETLRADLLTQLKTMSKTNGYRNDYADVRQQVVDLSQVTAFPFVFVCFNSGSISAIDTTKTTFSEDWAVRVEGYVDSAPRGGTSGDDLIDNGDSVLHDLKKCLTAFITTNMNSQSKYYIILGKENILKVYPLSPINQTTGAVGIDLVFRVRWDDYTTA